MDLDVLKTVVQLVSGALIGACIGMTGIGGGVLLLPVLTLGFGLPSTVAVGTAHLYSCLCKLPAVFFHFRQGTIRFRTSAYFLVGAVPVSVTVALWITGYAGDMDPTDPAWHELQTNLRQFIAAVVILSGLLILWHTFVRPVSRAVKDRAAQEEGQAVHRISARVTGAKIVLAVALGAVIGGLIASTSVGSGILIVPLMIIVYRLTAVDTVGSSIFIALVLTLMGSIIYAGSSQLDLAIAVTMAAGSLVGVPLGVRMSRRVPERYLQITITGLVLVAGLIMLTGG
ncbi:MAG: sulfite exporter TauE/SafE family protein [Gemmatimonadetes bacterium]|nr:sulfite exporter TauE/SafE family protein [Gemmatimonadota bacterium]MYD26411.1 sulfite exporter TauE/SafE family protein [Gemmatimonadota bacterium]MYI98415.1 sulfite exporter TauE/SafE family protein [Gemmatimonadota bacterium]